MWEGNLMWESIRSRRAVYFVHIWVAKGPANSNIERDHEQIIDLDFHHVHVFTYCILSCIMISHEPLGAWTKPTYNLSRYIHTVYNTDQLMSAALKA